MKKRLCLCAVFVLAVFSASGQETSPSPGEETTPTLEEILAKIPRGSFLDFFVGFPLPVIPEEHEEFSFTSAFGMGYARYPSPMYPGFALFAQVVLPSELARAEFGEVRGYRAPDLMGADLSLGLIRQFMALEMGRFIFTTFIGPHLGYVGGKTDAGTVSTTFNRLGLGVGYHLGAEWHPSRHFYFFARMVFSLDFFLILSEERLTTTTSIAGKTAYYVDRDTDDYFGLDWNLQPTLGFGVKLNGFSR